MTRRVRVIRVLTGARYCRQAMDSSSHAVLIELWPLMPQCSRLQHLAWICSNSCHLRPFVRKARIQHGRSFVAERKLSTFPYCDRASPFVTQRNGTRMSPCSRHASLRLKPNARESRLSPVIAPFLGTKSHVLSRAPDRSERAISLVHFPSPRAKSSPTPISFSLAASLLVFPEPLGRHT